MAKVAKLMKNLTIVFGWDVDIKTQSSKKKTPAPIGCINGVWVLAIKMLKNLSRWLLRIDAETKHKVNKFEMQKLQMDTGCMY